MAQLDRLDAARRGHADAPAHHEDDGGRGERPPPEVHAEEGHDDGEREGGGHHPAQGLHGLGALAQLRFDHFQVSLHELVDGGLEQVAHEQQALHVGAGLSRLPVGDGLARYEDRLREVVLGHVRRCAVLPYEVPEFHWLPFRAVRLPPARLRRYGDSNSVAAKGLWNRGKGGPVPMSNVFDSGYDLVLSASPCRP